MVFVLKKYLVAHDFDIFSSILPYREEVFEISLRFKGKYLPKRQKKPGKFNNFFWLNE